MSTETIISILNIYAPAALAISLAGLLYKVGMHLARVQTHRRARGVTVNAVDRPLPMSYFSAVRHVFGYPTNRFGMKSNPIFALGAVLYHIGIITISAGYAVSLMILIYRTIQGDMIPDVEQGLSLSQNYSPANIFALIFGNGEPLQAEFFFGDYASLFINITWVIIASAIVGNTLLLITHLFNRSGAILHDLDEAAKGLRTKGMFKASHLLVTGLVYVIIWTEIFARFDIIPGMVYIHSILGATMLLIFPFTYLFHMVYAPVAVFYAAKRWQLRYIA